MPPKQTGSGVFAGLTFCVSGSFRISQREMKERISAHGGRTAATPSQQCDYLVANAIGSGKTRQAQQNSVVVVDEDWVSKCTQSGRLSTDKAHVVDDSSSPHDNQADTDESRHPSRDAPKKGRGSKRKSVATVAGDGNESDGGSSSRSDLSANFASRVEGAMAAAENMDDDGGPGRRVHMDAILAAEETGDKATLVKAVRAVEAITGEQEESGSKRKTKKKDQKHLTKHPRKKAKTSGSQKKKKTTK